MRSPVVSAPLAFVAAAAAFTSPAARADVFDFSYLRAADGKVLSGQLDGTVQADGNTVVVTSVLRAPFLSGVPGVGLPFARSTDSVNFGTPGLVPKVTLDGSFMDLFAYSIDASSGGSGFAFAAGDASAAAFGTNGEPFVGFDGFYGATVGGSTFGFAEGFSAARWTLARAAAVPEPGTLSLLGAGALLPVAGAAVTRRRRRAV